MGFNRENHERYRKKEAYDTPTHPHNTCPYQTETAHEVSKSLKIFNLLTYIKILYFCVSFNAYLTQKTEQFNCMLVFLQDIRFLECIYHHISWKYCLVGPQCYIILHIIHATKEKYYTFSHWMLWKRSISPYNLLFVCFMCFRGHFPS